METVYVAVVASVVTLAVDGLVQAWRRARHRKDVAEKVEVITMGIAGAGRESYLRGVETGKREADGAP